MAVKNVKVWNKNGETRVYVKSSAGFESVLYITGNNWNKAGTWKKQGRFGIENSEIQEATELAFQNETWTNWPAPAQQNSNYRHTCPDCGGRDCGPNCNSNRSLGR